MTDKPLVAVVTFLGSNDDHDAAWALGAVGAEPVLVWHQDAELPAATGGVVLPGGFSYGDYLRTGAMASVAPVMDAVRAFADAGGPVLGICNGFQILCEARLLPGVLRPNRQLEFVCADATVRVWDTRPVHERWKADAQMRALRAAARPRVEALLEELGHPAAVARHIRAETSLTPQEREAALQALLQVQAGGEA